MPPRVFAPIKDIPREEWLALRRHGIGSSDIAAICGLSRFGSPLSVYHDKVGDTDPEPETSRMRMGRRLEAVVAAEFEEETGYVTEVPTVMYQHPDVDYMLASPDRDVITDMEAMLADGEREPDGVLEAKTYTGFGDLWDDGPPKAVVIQTTWQLLVTDRRVGWVGLLAHGHEYDQWRVELNDAVATNLMEIAAEFWAGVESRTPPPADGHDATTAALTAMYRDVTPEPVDMSEHRGALLQLKAARAACKEADAIKARLENTVKAALGHHTVGTIDGLDVVTWKPSAGFDEDRFKAEHPDIWAAHAKFVSKDAQEAGHKSLLKDYRVEGAGSRRLTLKDGLT